MTESKILQLVIIIYVILLPQFNESIYEYKLERMLNNLVLQQEGVSDNTEKSNVPRVKKQCIKKLASR